MKNNRVDLGLTGYNELFSSESSRNESKRPRIMDIPLSEIDDAPNHPFKVRVDEDMYKLMKSIEENGIIVPAIVRKKADDRYELVAGHRRKKACELAGIKTLKAKIRNISYDEAVVMMVESNFQRTKLLPSELAFSYKMRMDALKRQGKRTVITSSPLETKLRSDEKIAEISGNSRAQIQRYIRLTNLIPALLDMVDEDKIAFRPAVELSYLLREEQELLLDTIKCDEATPSLAQALKMKQFSKEGKLNADKILEIMCERKPNQEEKITFKAESLRKYIPRSIISPKETEEYILKALAHYRNFLKEGNK